jgi:hypothetical protein
MDDKALLQKYRMEIEELKAKLDKTNISNDKEKEAELSQMLAQEKAKVICCYNFYKIQTKKKKKLQIFPI